MSDSVTRPSSKLRSAVGVAFCVAAVVFGITSLRGSLRMVDRVAAWLRDEPSTSPWFVLDGRIEGEWELAISDWELRDRFQFRRDCVRIQLFERLHAPPTLRPVAVELPKTVLARGVVDWPECRWAFQLDAFDPGLWLRPSSAHDFGAKCADGWGDKVQVAMICKRDREEDVLVLGLGPRLPWLHYRRARPR